MFIVSKDKKAIINLEQVATMYIGSDGCSIKADYSRGNSCQLGRYDSDKEVRKAVEIVADSIGKTDVCFMPDANAIKGGGIGSSVPNNRTKNNKMLKRRNKDGNDTRRSYID